MAYQKQTWSDEPSTYTTITAERMNHIEDGIKDLDEFRDSISQYSTAETSTGQTWIDGKPIYRKVIELGVITQGTTKSVNHGASIDSLINAYGIAYYENKVAYFTFPRVGFSDGSPNSGWDLNAFIDASAIRVQTGYSGSYDGGHIVLEYTKSY